MTSRARSQWHIWSTATEGQLSAPRPLPWRDYWRLTRELTVERSGCGNWAEARRDDGTAALVLIRLGVPAA